MSLIDISYSIALYSYMHTLYCLEKNYLNMLQFTTFFFKNKCNIMQFKVYKKFRKT